MPKTALVTGACGFTGSHMLELLASEGWSVVATDLEGSERSTYYREGGKSVPEPVYYEDIFREVGAEFVPADITKPHTLEPVFEDRRYDAVFHVASLFDYFAETEILEKVNVEGAKNVAQKAVENDVDHFVHWSTLGVLGDAGFDGPKTENDRYSPHNRYCVSKKKQEEELLGMDELPLTVPPPFMGRDTCTAYTISCWLSVSSVSPP